MPRLRAGGICLARARERRLFLGAPGPRRRQQEQGSAHRPVRERVGSGGDAEVRARSVELDGSVDNFQRIDFNDRVQSIIVERGQWRLCSDAGGRGECREFGPGRHHLAPDLRARVSSAYPR